MTTLDLAIAVILAASMLIGVYRGFIRELLSLATLVAAVVVAVKFSDLPGVWLPDLEVMGFVLVGGDLQLALMFALLFIAVLIAGYFINKAISSAVRQGLMKLLDSLLGAVFGFVRGGAIILALMLLAGLTQLPFTEQWRTSVLIPPFEQSARYAMCYVPESYKNPHYACSPAQPAQPAQPEKPAQPAQPEETQ